MNLWYLSCILKLNYNNIMKKTYNKGINNYKLLLLNKNI